MKKYEVVMSGASYSVEIEEYDGSQNAAVTSPLRGSVSEICAFCGKPVNQGDLLLSIKTDKGECDVLAPVTGAVSKISVVVGDKVEPGRVLLLM